MCWFWREPCRHESRAALWPHVRESNKIHGNALDCPSPVFNAPVSRIPRLSRLFAVIAVVRFQPEIRLCANTGVELHLVEPLGFRWEDRSLKRAGLDYHEFARVSRHPGWEDCKTALDGRRFFALTTRGSRRFDTATFQPDDVLVFGRETRGLPEDVLGEFPGNRRLRLPMRPGQRSLNLSNAVAVAVFEAWRQRGFDGGV